METKFASAKDALLTFLSANGPEICFEREQVQKIPFLIHAEVGEEIGITDMFDFTPFGFGPHDENIYNIVAQCRQEGTIKSVPPSADNKFWGFQLTDAGYELGSKKLVSLPDNIQDYIRRLVKWVLERTFDELLASIHASFPDMQENSFYPNPDKVAGRV